MNCNHEISQKTEIILSGELGKRFGKKHVRYLDNAAEAGASLAHTLPGFERYMIESGDKGLRFAVYVDNNNMGREELSQYNGEFKRIRIVPVIAGKKTGGIIQTILGAILIVAGVILWATPAGVPLVASGVSMMLGGVIQMLSPQPAGLSRSESPDNKASYGFGSAKNTTAQGYPVGLLYGKRRIGGAIISAGIYVEDQQ